MPLRSDAFMNASAACEAIVTISRRHREVIWLLFPFSAERWTLE
ncbi:MAG: hypothetical protein ACPGXX_06425 [Planctomycetaceae bacterium]